VVWRVKFQILENVFGFAGLAMIVFAIAVWQFGPDWGHLLHEATHPIVPSGEGTPTYFYYGIALFGAVMTPYEVFFFSSGAVEEKWGRKDLITNRMNVYIGYPLGAGIVLAIMTISALFFAPHSISVDSLAQVALPPSLVLGKVALILAIVGFFAVTFSAALETSLSAGYTMAQFFGWQWGKFVKPSEAPRFHLVAMLSIAAGALLGLTSIDPIKVTEYSIVLSAAALPLTYFPLLIVANDRDYMGDKTNSKPLNILATLYLVLIVIVAVATIPLMIVTKAGQ